MLPARAPQSLRVIQAFDLIAPDGKIHRFPQLTRLQRAVAWLHSLAEPAILMAVVLGLIWNSDLDAILALGFDRHTAGGFCDGGPGRAQIGGLRNGDEHRAIRRA